MSRPPEVGSGQVLIDTSGYFALLDVSDADHGRAVAATASRRLQFITTNYILAETHALLVRRLGRAVAASFINETDNSRTVIIRVSKEDELRARMIIFNYTDKDYSLTDATSFAVMERLGIGEAFTFDRHFAQYGFARLGPGTE